MLASSAVSQVLTGTTGTCLNFVSGGLLVSQELVSRKCQWALTPTRPFPCITDDTLAEKFREREPKAKATQLTYISFTSFYLFVRTEQRSPVYTWELVGHQGRSEVWGSMGLQLPDTIYSAQMGNLSKRTAKLSPYLPLGHVPINRPHREPKTSTCVSYIQRQRKAKRKRSLAGAHISEFRV